MTILALEPYYGGSHKVFLDGLQAHIPVDLIMLTLPARKWKWRMRLAAPYFSDKVQALPDKTTIESVFCSSLVDVATLRSLLPASLGRLQFFTYFHENQFAYPVRREDERDLHFGLTNLTTVLASDRVAFNTRYNMQTFLAGVEQVLKICPDMKLDRVLEKIREKSTILYPGVDFSHIDHAGKTPSKKSEVPVIIWNHRWEHDKNPKYFFRTLFELDAAGIDFRLIILGQSFRTKPAIFDEARNRLQHRIQHCGYAETPEEYGRLLAMGDIVVSTAKHEFFGISVIEAVRAGCYPILPSRLSYPELFPAECLYGEGELFSKLQTVLRSPDKFDREQTKALTDIFSWPALKDKYLKWFSSKS